MEKYSQEFTGVVDSMIYANSKNGYTVLRLDVDDILVTAVGIMPGVGIGDQLKISGYYTKHPKYGEQFVVKDCERFQPQTTGAILNYLSSRSIKGIGPLTAQRIVDIFQDKTFDIIENYPQRLTEIRGITLQKAMKIHEEFQNANGFSDLLVYLKQYNITPEESVRIWRAFGIKSKELIEENPFLLCENGIDIPFAKANEIALSHDKNIIREPRTRAAILHTINHNTHNGHTCVPADKLIEVCSAYIHEDQDFVSDVLKKMTDDNSVFKTINPVSHKEFIYLPIYYQAETYIAARIKMLLRYPPYEIQNIDAQIDNIEKSVGFKYANLQKEAIRMALTKGVLILTGGPGTGKTTTLNAIIRILKDNGERVLLAAPTGRAAHRMNKVTKCDAKTIHRLLEVEWKEGDRPVFTRNEQNNLRCDTLVLDEVSMVDSLLFESLLKAVPLGCRLLFVGDNNQLPSVGAGNVLGDMIESGIIPTVVLNEIFRQSMESLIIINAHKINRGEKPIIDIKNNDFFFLKNDNPKVVLNTIVDLCIRRLPNSYGYSPLEDIQILSPSKIGDLGTTEINKAMQNALNPSAPNKIQITFKDKLLRIGDKVMQCKNNYHIPWTDSDGSFGEGIFNGDIGILRSIDTVNKHIFISFDNKDAKYTYDDIQDVELAYCCTIHKSQGNEFEAVIIPMYQSPKQLMYRNLLYTGVTRAKRLLILIGSPDAMMSMINNYKKTTRFTGLKDFLVDNGDE